MNMNHRYNRGKRLTAMALPCLILAFFSSGLPAVEENSLKAHELFYRGLYQEIGLGDPGSALRTYSKIVDGPLKGSTLAGNALVRKGTCYEKLGKKAQALACYNRAIEDYSDNASVLERAFAGLGRTRPKTKLVYYKERKLERLIIEGQRYEKEGALTMAKKRYLMALAVKPDNPPLQLTTASILKRLKDYKEASYHYERAAGSDAYRNDFSVHEELADCYKRNGDFHKAIKLWDSFLLSSSLDKRASLKAASELEFLKTDLGVQKKLADQHRRDRDFDSAIKVWNIYLENESLSERIRETAEFELELLYEASDYSEKRPIPWKLSISMAKGEELTKKRNYDSAIKAYNEVKRIFPKSYLPDLRLGYIYENLHGTRNTKDVKKTAINYYNSALKSAPPATAQRLCYRLALLYDDLGDIEKASYYIEQYFRRDPIKAIIMQEKERIGDKRMWQRVKELRDKSKATRR